MSPGTESSCGCGIHDGVASPASVARVHTINEGVATPASLACQDILVYENTTYYCSFQISARHASRGVPGPSLFLETPKLVEIMQRRLLAFPSFHVA